MAIGASRKRFSECLLPGQVPTPGNRNGVKILFPEAEAAPKKIRPKSFIDIEFPPCDESINKTIIKSILVPHNQASQDTTTGFDRLIQWRRPIEYLNSSGESEENMVTPQLFPASKTS